MRPTGRFLSLLVRLAPSFKSGLDYIRCSALRPAQIKVLCTIKRNSSEYTDEDVEAIRNLPVYLFSAFIEFLCKFSDFDAAYDAGHDISTADLFPIAMGERPTLREMSLFEHGPTSDEDIPHPQALRQAIQLTMARRVECSPAWTCLLACIGRDRTSLKISRSLQRILAWHEVLRVFSWMEEHRVNSGFLGFQHLCQSFSFAVVAGIVHPGAAQRALTMVRGTTTARRYNTFEDMVLDGLGILKTQFDSLVLPHRKIEQLFDAAWSEVDDLPMLHPPYPAGLHAFIRALGVAEDKDGLLSLLRWMSQSAALLKEVSDEDHNGKRMTRICLVASRVFLEGSWDRTKHSLETGHPVRALFPFRHGFTSEKSTVCTDNEAPLFLDPVVQEAYEIVTATPEWNGWPTDDEVENYMYGYGSEQL